MSGHIWVLGSHACFAAQVEERLRFYEDGVAPTKNLTAMQDALRTVAETAAAAAPMEDGVDPEEGVDAEARAVAAQPKKGKVRRQPALSYCVVRKTQWREQQYMREDCPSVISWSCLSVWSVH